MVYPRSLQDLGLVTYSGPNLSRLYTGGETHTIGSCRETVCEVTAPCALMVYLNIFEYLPVLATTEGIPSTRQVRTGTTLA